MFSYFIMKSEVPVWLGIGGYRYKRPRYRLHNKRWRERGFTLIFFLVGYELRLDWEKTSEEGK